LATAENNLYGYSGETGQPQPGEPDDATDRLACWDSGGTAYQLPLPPALKAPAQVAPMTETAAAHKRAVIIDNLLELEPAFPPPRRSAMPWALFGSALVIATALLLWQPWSVDGEGAEPAQDHVAALSPPTLESAQTTTESPVQTPLPIASEAAATTTLEPAPAMTEAPVQAPEPVTGEAASATTLEESAEGDRSYIVRPAQTEPLAEPPAVSAATPAAEQPAQPAPTLAAEADAILAVEKELSASAPVRPTPRAAAPAQRPAVAQAASKPTNAAKASAKAKSAAAQSGTLIVAVKPWGEVWVDGSKRGISPPLIKLQLPAGRHQIELRNPGQPSFEQSVEISAGQSLTLQHSFQ
jgi:hypothetical protein